MNKEKFLQQLSRQKDGNVKKLNLSAMSDLADAINDMQSYDLEYEFSTAFTEYEYALGLMEQAIAAADKYIPAYSKFEEMSSVQWEAYQKASDLYSEVSSQLYDLGIEESPELAKYGDFLAEAETQGQKAFQQTQEDFPEHNELVDISNFN